MLESRQNSVDSGRVDSRFAGPGGFAGNNASRPVTGPGGGGGGFYEPDRYSQASNYGNGRHDNDRNGRWGGSHARADARSGYKNDDFSGSRGTTPLRGGSGFGFDARRDTLHGQNNMDGGHNVSRDFAHMSLGRGAPPLPPGAPPGGRQRPLPPPMEDERDEARDAFQLELERVMAEQEAERRRREITLHDLSPAPGAGAGGSTNLTGTLKLRITEMGDMITTEMVAGGGHTRAPTLGLVTKMTTFQVPAVQRLCAAGRGSASTRGVTLSTVKITWTAVTT